MTEWQKCASVTPGGKPFFYIRRMESGGFERIVWNRDVKAYAATRDQKDGSSKLLSYAGTPGEACLVFD